MYGILYIIIFIYLYIYLSISLSLYPSSIRLLIFDGNFPVGFSQTKPIQGIHFCEDWIMPNLWWPKNICWLLTSGRSINFYLSKGCGRLLTQGSQDGPSDCPNLPGFPQDAEDPLRSGLASWRADDPIIPGEWVLSTPKKGSCE